ncbi:MAG: hypothetical protein ABJC19_05575, partial [Gemmatimonadota bacterium]
DQQVFCEVLKSKLQFAAAGLLLLSACDSPTSPTMSVPNKLARPAALTVGTCAMQDTTNEAINFKPYWSCSKVISFSASDAQVHPLIVQAATAWQDRLGEFANQGIPQFYLSVASSGEDVEVVVEANSSGEKWCGSTAPIAGVRERITITTSNCNGNTDSRVNILRHEMAHVLGWTSQAHKPTGAAGHSDACMIVLPADISHVNSSVCDHEIEGLLYRYSLRSDIDQSHFWDRDFGTGTSTNKADRSITTNATLQLTAGSFLWPTGSESWPTSSQSWTSNNPGVATVTHPGLVSPVANGTTYIRVTPAASPSGGYLRNDFLDRGDSIKVTVAIPVDTFLRVNDITFPRSLPIIVADSFNLTALVAGDGGTGASVSWVILYSTGVLPNDSTAFGANTYFLRVPTGSYRITAKAYPKQANKIGARAEVDLTVCPGPGGNYIRVPTGSGGTDAVAGC